MRAIRPVVTRLSLLIGGTVAGLLLLEVVLQAAGLYTSLTRPRDAQSWLRGGQRIVCLGDSNTFGFFLERPTEEAYPRQVQALWNAREGAEPIEVLNLGVPGMNSSKVRAVLPDIIRTLRPDIVSVMVGVNDFWIDQVPNEAWGLAAIIDAAWHRSRVARLAHMIRRAREQRIEETIDLSLPKFGEEQKSDVVLRYGDERIDLTPPAIGGTHKPWRKDLEANVIAMAEEAALHNVQLLVLTYPAEGMLYNQANASMRTAAARSGATLIDLGGEFLKLCPSRNCEDLFYFDLHPRLKGHQLAAQMIVDSLHGEDSVVANR